MVVQHEATAGERKILRRERHIAAEDRGHAGHRIHDEQIGEPGVGNAGLPREHRWRNQLAVAHNDPGVAVAEARVRIVENGDLPLELFGVPRIVLVAERKQIALVATQ